MDVTIEKVSPSSENEMLDFLKKHENFSLFLLGNFENYGSSLSESPYSGNFKLIRSSDKIVGVFSLTKKGNLLIETTLQNEIFDLVLDACRQESISLQGIVGNWKFCEPFWDYLKAKKVIQKEIFNSKEILYQLELAKSSYISPLNVRVLSQNDFEQWKPLRLDYLNESGLSNELTDEQFRQQFLLKIAKKIIWGYFLKDTLVSIADLNAKALDLGQVGGVYTDPSFRKRGYSTAVMNKLLSDAKHLHGIRKLIIFTGENNHAAQKVYLSLGATPVGHFALFFGKTFTLS